MHVGSGTFCMIGSYYLITFLSSPEIKYHVGDQFILVYSHQDTVLPKTPTKVR